MNVTDDQILKASKIIEMQAQMIAEAKIGLKDLIRMSNTGSMGNIEVHTRVSEILNNMNQVREKYGRTSD